MCLLILPDTLILTGVAGGCDNLASEGRGSIELLTIELALTLAAAANSFSLGFLMPILVLRSDWLTSSSSANPLKDMLLSSTVFSEDCQVLVNQTLTVYVLADANVVVAHTVLMFLAHVQDLQSSGTAEEGLYDLYFVFIDFTLNSFICVLYGNPSKLDPL